MRLTSGKVNKRFKSLGFKERLRQEKGYCRFYKGNTHTWKSTIVPVNRVENLSLEQWEQELNFKVEENNES